MSKSDKLYLVHILEAFAKINSYTKDGKDSFFNNTMIQDAVYRNFEIIGEASNRVSKATKQENSHINWVGAIGFRNVIIHNYDGVDPQEVWTIANTTLVEFVTQVKELLQNKFGITL